MNLFLDDIEIQELENGEDDLLCLQVTNRITGRRIGTGSLRFNDDVTARLELVETEPEFRSRGIGTLLARDLHREATRRGLRRILIHAPRPARPFFEYLGYGHTTEPGKTPDGTGRHPMAIDLEPGKLALFDIDDTIIAAGSARLYFRWLREQGRVGRMEMVRSAFYYIAYKLNLFTMEKAMRRGVAAMRGSSEKKMIADCVVWFRDMVRRHIYVDAEGEILRHMIRGHRVVLISAATQYISGPLAGYLGVDDYLCTRLESKGGTFTGGIVEPPCYREGKVTHARLYCERHGLELDDAVFYTDSITDRALLEAVGEPVAVNPDPKLSVLAGRRRWPVRRFSLTRNA